VTLTKAAPAGGATVSLFSSNAALAKVPASVLVPAGASSTNFVVTTVATRKTTSVTISASFAGITRTATLGVKRR